MSANQHRLDELVRQVRAVSKSADLEGRELKRAEKVELHRLLDEVDNVKSAIAVEGQVDSFGRAIGAPGSSGPQVGGQSSTYGAPGDVFVASEGYKSVCDPGSRPQRWTSGAVPVSSTAIQTKAGTLYESGQGAGFVATPQVIPGVVSKLFEPLGVADLFPSSPAETSSLRYIVEGTATSGAAGVAEGGAKPTSDFAYSTVDEPVRKIATTLGPISDELFSDAPSVSTYLNSRLGMFVRIEEERQLLRGSGTNELLGIFGRGINTYARGTVDNQAIALFKGMMGTRGSAHLDVDAIVCHPTDWQTIRLLTDSNGQLYGGGPFHGSYGGPQGPAPAAGVFSTNTLWNVPVVLSTVVGAGTALLGAFSTAAHIKRRGGLTVESSNSHDDWFVRDLIALRAEQREALCCFRPSSFTQVVGL
jgi:HK97 family phage major capsid protein